MSVDTTKDIWERLFLVRVPALNASSIDYLKAHGTYITGNKNIDKANANAWLTTYMSIAKMVELFKEGVSISVLNPKDTKIIYDAIEAHLLAWKNELQYGLNVGNAPIQDLIDMDKFANVVYRHAKYHITPDFVESLFARKINERFNRISPVNFIKSNDPEVKPQVTQPEERDKTLSDYFKSRIFGQRGF